MNFTFAEYHMRDIGGYAEQQQSEFPRGRAEIGNDMETGAGLLCGDCVQLDDNAQALSEPLR